ncbi:MAG TPA: hypothetical protein VGP92_16710 [Acidimicrobiia bacterium]|nr:hypothetical protein [Acidimicrobiia bacterium]
MKRSKVWALVCAVAIVGAACSSSAKSGSGTTPTTAAAVKVEPPGTGSCDNADPARCLLPFPNDHFTRADPSSPTGRRLDLPASGMPANKSGKHIDPTEWNRNDGFSPSSIGLTVVPNLDLATSKLPPQTDIAQSLAPGSPVVVTDTTTGTRVAAWAETDPRVTVAAQRLLRIVPATGLLEGHRIEISLHDLKRTDGSTVPPLKWSFTIASEQGLSGRLRSMWAQTSAALGDAAPKFTVSSTEDSGAARIVRGTFQMPKYLTGNGGPGSVFNNGDVPSGIPTANGTMNDEFVCTVPKSAHAGAAPFVLYGHGLLGSRDEALGIGGVAASAGLGFCAVDELGMSSADIPTVIQELADLSKFRTQADRLQQGQLGFLVLGRLLANAKGFGSHRAFQDASGASIIDAKKLSLLGASQGGILGGVASSIATDWNRVILAVGGMGYNLLLRRSVDFDKFVGPFDASYPDPVDQALALELMEQLWDRGENTGYAQHLTASPYPGTGAAKTVLMLEAFGDHQVANVATEKLARTLGIERRAPTLTTGRSADRAPFFGIDPLTALPHRGSALVVWDFGTPTPPPSETPNRAGDDPHGKLADVPQALALVAGFIGNGTVIDVCNNQPCHTP